MSNPNDPIDKPIRPDKPVFDPNESTIKPVDISRGSKSRRNITISLILLAVGTIVAFVVHVITRLNV